MSMTSAVIGSYCIHAGHFDKLSLVYCSCISRNSRVDFSVARYDVINSQSVGRWFNSC